MTMSGAGPRLPSAFPASWLAGSGACPALRCCLLAHCLCKHDYNWYVLMFVCQCMCVAGGLGDVMQALPKAMAKRGHRVMCIAPRYKNYDVRASSLASCGVPLLWRGVRFPAGCSAALLHRDARHAAARHLAAAAAGLPLTLPAPLPTCRHCC